MHYNSIFTSLNNKCNQLSYYS